MNSISIIYIFLLKYKNSKACDYQLKDPQTIYTVNQFKAIITVKGGFSQKEDSDTVRQRLHFQSMFKWFNQENRSIAVLSEETISSSNNKDAERIPFITTETG